MGLWPSISYNPDMVYSNFLGGFMGRKVLQYWTTIHNLHVPSPWTIRVGRNTSSMDLVTLWVCYVKLRQMTGPWPHYWPHRKMIVNILRIHRCPEWSSVLGCLMFFFEYILDVLFDEFSRMAFVYFTVFSMFWFLSVKKWCLMTCPLTGNSWL